VNYGKPRKKRTRFPEEKMFLSVVQSLQLASGKQTPFLERLFNFKNHASAILSKATCEV
jgi:hypothetical protein